MSSDVAIVLATFNGARYLPELLDSLEAQEVTDWRLFARDDASSDATVSILQAAAARDGRISILQGGGRLGVVGNFAAVLEHALANGVRYVFPCDQDDVWLPGKVASALELMNSLEGHHGKEMPLLVHSDLRVVDDSLRVIHPSYMAFQGIRHVDDEPVRVLLTQNFVTGCTSLYNRPLLALGAPVPKQVIMHDWWFALCAAVGGRIGFLPEASILYRQHAANEVGADGPWGSWDPFRARGRRRLTDAWGEARRTVAQARALRIRLANRREVPVTWRDLVEDYARLDGKRGWERVSILRRYRVHRLRRMDTAAMMVRALLPGWAPL